MSSSTAASAAATAAAAAAAVETSSWWAGWLAGIACAAVAILAALATLTWVAGGTSGLAGVGPSKPFRLHGRDAVITGGASGIGLQLAKRLVDAGVFVHLVDIDEDALERAAREIGEQHAATQAQRPEQVCETHLCDVADPEAFPRVLKDRVQVSARRRGRHVSLLINNAGVVSGKAWEDLSATEFERTVRVGAIAHFAALKTLLPDMVAHADGAVITVSSLMGLLPGAQLADYCAAKHAAVGLHEAMRLEVKDVVHFLLVCPYLVDTPMFQGAFEAPNLWLVRKLFPPLRAGAVADSILGALCQRQYTLILPRVLALAPFLAKLLPVKLYETGLTWMGARDGMRTARICTSKS
ncbi:Short-chain dehydrogenase/reductase family 16C member 6 [Hondaea fermentalgiana]|uniref:Short-chain dehydrogenase/reductase family 16C member 6 n=1 Tax=Hondaea fermentalgiana TaxID=2315210 RepID=A0A2R5GA78_9STRA|nr:Short-chain dehydrogenase/reductase family 16C member 6 [Hondaea fermentalgiana]|eukprot:GBG27926.1 Short-chain dehydrogenase/reductase family 16C member 6 [Hondaea fermentalgiana]